MKATFLATLVAASAASYNVSALTVSDGDFSTWIPFSVVADDPAITDPGPGNSAGSGARVTSGGIPGAYLEVNHTFSYGDRIVSGGIKTDYEYNPATEGPLQNFAVSLSLLHPPKGSSAWYLVIEQNGQNYFSYPYSVVDSTAAWVKVRKTNLNARNFDSNPLAGIGGIAPEGRSPDLGPSGAKIRFGFAFGNTVINGHLGDSLTHQLGMDNFLVTTSITPTVSVAATQPTGAEGGESPQFVIALDSIQKRAVVVEYAIRGSAKNGQDYKRLKGRARIKAGATGTTVTVNLVDDNIKEPAETIVLRLKKTAAYDLDATAKKAQAIITDND